MNKRTVLNIALLIFLAGLVLIARYQPGQSPPAVAPALELFDAGNVARIDVIRTGKDTVALEKSGAQWRMTAPLQVPADRFLVDTLLGMAKATAHAQFAAGGVSLGDFRLDAPRLTVRLDDVEVAFGDTEPLSGRRYVMVGATVYLIDDTLFHQLTGGTHTFVARQLLPADSRIESLILPAHTITRSDGGDWVVTPEQPDLSQDDVVALIDEWLRAQAIRVGPAEMEDAGASVTVQLAGAPAPLRFALLAHDAEWLLVRPDLGIRYHFTEHQFARLTTLASRTPLPE